MNASTLVLTLGVWITLSYAYHSVNIPELPEVKIFLSLSTFLFSIFTGFFFSRQSKRYSEIRDLLSDFDGQISVIFRFSHHLSKTTYKHLKAHIKKMYTHIVKKDDFIKPFNSKSSFIIDIHGELDKLKGKKLTPVASGALSRTFVALHNTQVLRKRILSIEEERIPTIQWVIIYALAGILLFILGTINSPGLVSSIVKGSYGAVIILVIVMLRKFEHFQFFEDIVGERSAQDILDLIDGKK